MDLTLLVDNTTFTDRYLTAEPGLSILVEDEDVTVLFDLGYSDLFLKNAVKLGKDLSCLDFLVLSHSHLDHTWGLDPFIRYLTERTIEGLAVKHPKLVAHPEVFSSVSVDGLAEIGSLVTKEKAARHMALTLTKTPVNLSSRLVFLGEIPRENLFEGQTPIGMKQTLEGPVPDLILDDSALAYKSDRGLVIITGCSHAGICNIVSHARKVCGDQRIADVIGGFHLLNPSTSQMAGTLDYFRQITPLALHACHCTDLDSKVALAGVAPLKDTGVGLSLHFDPRP
ncbi:MBL fold metallo-hydrolase [Desulfobacter postgatei]|jgi:7,8-dihydropterin-6-yl-methyl-4-(beta-D-ribofuranosyl)aminobenzene 5'-phosphate synthase|uniref:MBL fold metallo-hydrolase n=1 Tax=Desulfobacter postgatei TaxID=2293 RepID=UPI002A35C6EA|nr:MBL fold metallo-hydrolase [Desulfobacter postgatei]MDX9965173.1 MBL fold metallo-hydrolase [Desulfobacter postgatei]